MDTSVLSRFKQAGGGFSTLAAQLFGKKAESAIGIDIGSSSIKVIQLRKTKGAAILETYGEMALGPYADFQIGQATQLSEGKLVDAVADIIREANVTAKTGAFSIPLASSIISVIEVPDVSEAKLKEMIPIEARRYIPVPVTEVSLDWQILHEEPKEGVYGDDATRQKKPTLGPKNLKILIAAIHNETLSRYRNLSAKLELDLRFLEIEIFSTIRTLAANIHSTMLIVDIGAGTTKLSLVDNGIVYASHIINRGSQDITFTLAKSLGITFMRAEEMKREEGISGAEMEKNGAGKVGVLVVNEIFSQANKMLFDFEKRYNKTMDSVVLSGGGALLKGMTEIAQKSFDVPVIYADPFALVKSPAFLAPILTEAGPNFAVAVGLALRALEELR